MQMRLFEITEEQLIGDLFVNLPISWSIEKSRKALEEMVRLLGWDELNPASVWHGLTELRKRIYNKTHQKGVP